MLRAFLVVLASRFMMTFLLNDHSGTVMMTVLVVFPSRFIVTVLNHYHGSVIRDLHAAIGQRACLGRAHEEGSSASQK